MTMTTELPIIDMSRLADGEAGERAIAAELDAIFSTVGFCYFRNIGISPALTDQLFAASQAFHAQSEAAKRALAMNASHRGYMAPNSSLIVTSTVASVKRPNFSESLMIMHEVDPSDPRYGTEVHGPNQWPELPGFRAAVAAYEAAYGSVPGTYAMQAYDAAMLIDSALKATGGKTSDQAAVRTALEKADFKSLRGKFKFGVNHYPVQDFYQTRVAKRADGKYQTEIAEKVFTDYVDVYAAECQMKK